MSNNFCFQSIWFCNHFTYAFQCESTLYSCLNVKELFAQNKHNIWSLSDSNTIQTHNHIVCKQTLNHLVKLAIWLSCVSTYLYDASVHLTVCYYHLKHAFQCESALYSCLKQARYLKFKWQQQDLNLQPPSS